MRHTGLARSLLRGRVENIDRGILTIALLPSSLASTSQGGGLQVLCRVHLVPIRGGLVELPRLDVVVERGSAAPGEVSLLSLSCRTCRCLFVRFGSHRVVRTSCALRDARACRFPCGARSAGDCGRYSHTPWTASVSPTEDTTPHWEPSLNVSTARVLRGKRGLGESPNFITLSESSRRGGGAILGQRCRFCCRVIAT